MVSLQDIVAVAKDISQIIEDLLKVPAQQATLFTKQVLVKALAAFVVALGASLLGTIGLLVVFWGVWVEIAEPLGDAVAAFIVGGALVFTGAVVLLFARIISRS